MSNLALYLLGAIIVAGALAFGAAQLGIPGIWIGVGVAAIIGIALMSGISNTRRRETSEKDS